MTTLGALVNLLYQQAGPALTWYGADRVELGGPVVARWLAKSANLLGTDHSPALWGGPEAGTLALTLGRSWQGGVWALAARLMGWHVVPTGEGGADLEITAALTEEHLLRAEEGAAILAQDLSPLSFAWPGVLPETIGDALGALMAQPDVLACSPGEDAQTVEEFVAASGVPTGPALSRVMVLSVDAEVDAAVLAANWLAGTSVVLVDPDHHDLGAREGIGRAEGAHLLL